MAPSKQYSNKPFTFDYALSGFYSPEWQPRPRDVHKSGIPGAGCSLSKGVKFDWSKRTNFIRNFIDKEQSIVR
jgi:hypothetical protein